jgi:hypothetical protein
MNAINKSINRVNHAVTYPSK